MSRQGTKSPGETKSLEELYRIYEFADGLCFPKIKFRCGHIDNYVKTGILTEKEASEGTVSVRREGVDQGSMPVEQFINFINTAIAEELS